jgi:ATP-dependent protease ClpP protease subunit
MFWTLGDERYIYPKTFCMYHSMSSGMFGKTKEIKDFGNFI